MSKNKLNGGYTYGSNMSNPFNEEYIDLNPSQITRTNSINYSDLESNNEDEIMEELKERGYDDVIEIWDIEAQ